MTFAAAAIISGVILGLHSSFPEIASEL